jgi:Xaa-Pro aminopeptidase
MAGQAKRGAFATHPMDAAIRAELARHFIGLTIAHEIGHGLGLRHSASGVMKPDADMDDMLALRQSRLRFASREAVRMREQIDEQRKSSESTSRSEREFRR